jgi:hypothetical protein
VDRKRFQTETLAHQRIRINVISWTRIRIGISLQLTSQSVWKMSLFEHFSKVLSLYLEGYVRIRIKVKKGVRIHIKGTSRIRRYKVMRIRNTALALRKVLYFIPEIQSITGTKVCPASLMKV